MSANKMQKKHHRFALSKCALAVSAVLATVNAPAVMANDTPPKLAAQSAYDGNDRTVRNFRDRHRNQSKVIEGQYIVLLEQQDIDKRVTQMTANASGIMSHAAIMDIKRQAVMSTTETMVATYGTTEVLHNYYASVSGFVARMDHDTMLNMARDPRVALIEPDMMMYTANTQFDATWGLDRIDQNDLPLNSQYDYELDGTGVTAYVLDTGILDSHRDFEGRVASGFTAINDGRGTSDCQGHGTHVAGTVGSETYGVAKNVTLVPVRVLGCNGSGSNSGVIAGVDWVAQNATGPSVANMSLGGGSSRALDQAVQRAVRTGVTFAVAAGNSNSDACSGSPNRVPEALTIASSTRSDARSSFSSWGSCIDMFAPGSSITSTWNNGRTRTISGTSMASPHVAGVAALYLQANPSASPSQVESALESAAARNKIRDVRGSPNLLVQSTFSGPAPSPTPVPSPTPAPNCVPGALDLRDVSPYSSSNTGDSSVSANGCSMTLSGNVWRITSDGYTITPETTVSFDFSASGNGEIQGIGFDTDTDASESQIFRLAGSQDWGISDFSYTGNGSPQRISIPVGQYYTGSNMGFVIANDKDSGATNNVVTVSNVVISNGSAPPSSACINLESAAPFSNTNTGSAVANGCSMVLNGNIWRATDETFNITPSSVLSFEFSANNTGEIHGIGFDEDNNASNNRIFQLSGSQTWGIGDYRYSGGTQTFEIPVGQYFTGNAMRLILVNDKDQGAEDNQTSISNIRLID